MEVKGLVRILETTVEGQKKISVALLRVKGVGHALSLAIPRAVGLDPSRKIGTLSDGELEKLEDAIKNPAKYGIPSHMLNRRRDPKTGEDRHLSESDLVLTRKSDIDFLKKIRCYRGIRHELGLPVRGQRTRSSFRKGRTVGVSRKKK